MLATVYDFCNLFVDGSVQDVAIYDTSLHKETFRGTADEVCMSDFADEQIISVDNISGSNTEIVTINI